LKCEGARGTRHYDKSVLDKVLWIEAMIADDGCKTSHVQTAESCGLHHRMIRRSTFESGEMVPTITIQPKDLNKTDGVKEEQVVLGIASLKTLVDLAPLLREHFVHLSSFMTPAYLSKYDQTVHMLCESLGGKLSESDANKPETYRLLSNRISSLAGQQRDHKLKVIMYELLENSLDVIFKSVVSLNAEFNKPKKITCDGMEVELDSPRGAIEADRAIAGGDEDTVKPKAAWEQGKRMRTVVCDCSRGPRERDFYV
jgi:hypothetical protein